MPICDNGSGEAIANAVHETLSDWSLLDQIEGMCFDTTASNTGVHKGACKFIEKKLGRELFACRHHVCEIILRGVFEAKFGKSKAPEVKLFEDFQKAFDAGKMIPNNYKSGVKDSFVQGKIDAEVSKDVIDFCRKQ